MRLVKDKEYIWFESGMFMGFVRAINENQFEHQHGDSLLTSYKYRFDRLVPCTALHILFYR